MNSWLAEVVWAHGGVKGYYRFSSEGSVRLTKYLFEK